MLADTQPGGTVKRRDDRGSDAVTGPLRVFEGQQQSVWDLGNQVLYDLCKSHPAHKTDVEIVAKVWLIGRSYAASIERRKNPEQLGDDFYKKIVAPTIKASGIDSWIASVMNTDIPGSPITISVHKRLTDLFESITGLGKRSLASKYLHFHVPELFYIYDSRARKAIIKVTPRLNAIPDVSTDRFDREYKDFVRRCVWLREDIHAKHGTYHTPREIDTLLLRIADDESGAPGRPSTLRQSRGGPAPGEG